MATMDSGFMEALFSVLCSVGEDTVLEVLTATFGRLPDARVHLVCEDLSPEDALSYARVLNELGQATDARELLAAVVRHAAGLGPHGLVGATEGLAAAA